LGSWTAELLAASWEGISSMKIDSYCYWITNSMVLNPSWEVTNHSVTQEFPNILWNLKLHDCIHKSLPLIPVLEKIISVHTTTFYFSKIHCNITFPLKSRSSYWSLSFWLLLNVIFLLKTSMIFWICNIDNFTISRENKFGFRQI
jgi:hypothetical protein